MTIHWDFYAAIPLYSIGVFGNLMIILYFIRINRKSMRDMTAYHFLILQLAFFDLVICCDNICYKFFDQNSVSLGLVYCRYVWLSLGLSPYMVSCWILVLLSYERYRKIVHPFKKKIRNTKLFLICLSLWGFFVGFYFYLTLDVVLTPDGTCNFLVKPVKNFIYLVTERFLDCVLPTFVMVYLFRGIRKKISSSVQSIRRDSFVGPQQVRYRTALATLKNLVIVYVVFVFPARLMQVSHYSLFLIDPEFVMRNRDTINNMRLYINIHFSVNNIINFIVYARMIPGFRRFIIKVITFGIC